MDLDEAYRILEVEAGASEDVVREARKTLAKVWHPDRHANDPELQKRAQSKLADVNAAFERVNKAGFPAKATPKPRSPTAPPAPVPAPPPPPPATSNIEFVGRRRIRWPVIFVLAAAIGVGAYFAIMRLGGDTHREVVAIADAAGIPLAPDATVVVAGDAPSAIVRREKTFTLGSSRDDVIAAQGQPNGTSSNNSTVNGVRTGSAQLTFGSSSTVDFDGDDQVIGWAEHDTPLHVRLEIADATSATRAKARGTFAVGSSRDEVLALLGPPTQIAGDRWSYGTSTLDFHGGVVATWTDGDPKLPIAR